MSCNTYIKHDAVILLMSYTVTGKDILLSIVLKLYILTYINIIIIEIKVN